MNAGTLAVLNVGAGDTKLTFDPAKPEERERARRAVTDMLARGYAILVQVGDRDGEPLYVRARGFDPETCEYIIVGVPDADDRKPGKRGRGRPRRVPAERTPAVAVARTAGG